MPRHLACAASVALLLLIPAAAEAAPTKVCKSADMRYPFQPGGPKTFGVFRLTITGGRCGTARRVARRWMDRFEAKIDEGVVKLPRRVRGFDCVELSPPYDPSGITAWLAASACHEMLSLLALRRG